MNFFPEVHNITLHINTHSEKNTHIKYSGTVENAFKIKQIYQDISGNFKNSRKKDEIHIFYD